MGNYVIGIGLLCQSAADVLKSPPDFTAGFNDLMKGLAALGVHQTIIKSMREQGLNPDTLKTENASASPKGEEKK